MGKYDKYLGCKVGKCTDECTKDKPACTVCNYPDELYSIGIRHPLSYINTCKGCGHRCIGDTCVFDRDPSTCGIWEDTNRVDMHMGYDSWAVGFRERSHMPGLEYEIGIAHHEDSICVFEERVTIYHALNMEGDQHYPSLEGEIQLTLHQIDTLDCNLTE